MVDILDMQNMETAWEFQYSISMEAKKVGFLRHLCMTGLLKWESELFLRIVQESDYRVIKKVELF